MAVFIDSVMTKYGIRIDQNDLATVHRRSRGDLVARFVKTHPGSAFNKLAHRRGVGKRNPKPNLQIYANVLLSNFDDKDEEPMM